MNISDLSKIDIKDINFAGLKDLAKDRKDIVFQIVAVVISVILILFVYTKSQAEAKRLNAQIALMQSKTGAILDYNNVQNEINQLLKEVPVSLMEDQIISFVTDLADKHSVKILTFSPSRSQENTIIQTVSLQFSLQAKDYKNIVYLINDIERAKNSLQVKMCSTQSQVINGPDNTEELLINFRINVVSVKVKS